MNKIITIIATILLCFSTVISCSSGGKRGHITFDVTQFPGNPKAKEKPQKVMFLGCDTQKVYEFNWQEKGQKIAVPYHISDQRCPNGSCYASKYYMASPPVFAGKQAILGQLKPDYFTWHADNLNQSVVMDYSVLAPLTLGEIHANFNHNPASGQQSCDQQKVTFVPINIDCPDLPRIHGKMGASGIGFLKSTNGKSQIFIPHMGPEKNKTSVQCSVSILDDIILGHDIYFDDDGTYKKTISMTKLYNNNEYMNFVCKKRQVGDVPVGCLDILK